MSCAITRKSLCYTNGSCIISNMKSQDTSPTTSHFSISLHSSSTTLSKYNISCGLRISCLSSTLSSIQVTPEDTSRYVHQYNCNFIYIRDCAPSIKHYTIVLEQLYILLLLHQYYIVKHNDVSDIFSKVFISCV